MYENAKKTDYENTSNKKSYIVKCNSKKDK